MKKTNFLQHHYSGKLSALFWKKIDAFSEVDNKKWLRLYGLGCKLQNLESEVLKLLKSK